MLVTHRQLVAMQRRVGHPSGGPCAYICRLSTCVTQSIDLAWIVMQSQSLNNRLHRSGAIDFNVEFDLRQSQVHAACNSSSGTKYMSSAGGSPDTFSVCEGEPLYHVKQSSSHKSAGIQSSRCPIRLLSSLNGIVIHQVPFKNGANPDVWSEELRETFFKNLRVSGVAVTKWDYGRVGHQANQFVATSGGLNTIYVDEDVAAGDLVIADIPHVEKLNCPLMGSMQPDTHELGFVKWQHKKGVPKEKKTLVVRPMPRGLLVDELASFHARGQVLGVCVRGAKRGERADIVHGHNAIGVAGVRKKRERP